MDESIAFKNEFGIWIYNSLPNSMRVATKQDFCDTNGEVIIGKKFLVQSFHYQRYEAHYTRDNFFIKWDEWLNNYHIFIQVTED